MQTFEVRAIGTVRSGRATPEDDAWDSVLARIEIDPEMLDGDATAGLADFSHIEVVFLFDRVREESVCRGARHPRGREDWPLVGILAQRAKDRPNRLGSTVCRVLRVGPGFIEVQGLDAIEGTPEPPWATELMAGYW